MKLRKKFTTVCAVATGTGFVSVYSVIWSTVDGKNRGRENQRLLVGMGEQRACCVRSSCLRFMTRFNISHSGSVHRSPKETRSIQKRFCMLGVPSCQVVLDSNNMSRCRCRGMTILHLRVCFTNAASRTPTVFQCVRVSYWRGTPVALTTLQGTNEMDYSSVRQYTPVSAVESSISLSANRADCFLVRLDTSKVVLINLKTTMVISPFAYLSHQELLWLLKVVRQSWVEYQRDKTPRKTVCVKASRDRRIILLQFQ